MPSLTVQVSGACQRGTKPPLVTAALTCFAHYGIRHDLVPVLVRWGDVGKQIYVTPQDIFVCPYIYV